MMNFKRVGSIMVALALSVSCLSTAVVGALKWQDGQTPRDIFRAKLSAAESAEKVKLTADEKEVLVDRFLEAFESGDFSGLSFYERSAVFDDDMFSAFMDENGLGRRQKNKLLKARTGAFDVVEIERDIDYYDWLESAEFLAFLASTNLTDEQKQGLAESKPVFHDTAMLDAYLRMIKLSESEQEAFKADLHKAYEEARYGGITEPVGYTTEDFQFNAFVAMLESGDFDELLAKRDKDKHFSASDKLALAQAFEMFSDFDEADVYGGMRTQFKALSEAE